MKKPVYLLPILLLTACGSPEIKSQKREAIDGNNLEITTGAVPSGRFVSVVNVEKRWEGKLAGGKEKWGARQALLKKKLWAEMEGICGSWPYIVLDREPFYNMMDKDETLGGMAPVLGIAASMAAYMAAYSSTDEANIPVSVYADFHCRNDESAR